MNLLGQISRHVFIPKAELRKFIKTIPNRYKRYPIPKRNGDGVRIIAHPAKVVKPLQRLCVDMLRELKIPVHEAATAYEKGTGIKRNAEAHKRNKYLLKMDFSNFFPSITPDAFFSICAKHGLDFTDEDKHTLSYVLFWRARRYGDLVLSIGAPSSPFISNAVMYFFDEALVSYCADNGISYTRYADDLTFSTNNDSVLFSIPDVVNELIEKLGQNYLVINRDKTVFASKKTNRHITGITINNNDELSLGRERKKQLRSMIYRFTLGILSEEEALKLKGHLGFAKHIEPEFVERMKAKYGEDAIIKIQKFNAS